MSDEVSDKTSIFTSETFSGRLKAIDDAPPALVVLMGPTGYVGKQWALVQSEIVLGRSVECQIYIDDKSVSKNHARVNILNGEATIMDLGSTNGTTINTDTALMPMTPYRLTNNDQIKTGNVIFKYLEKGNIEAITNQELNEKALRDALTGAYSKRALLERGPEAIKRSEFLNEDLSILVFDLDHFKKINDKYGHSAGDFVLKEIGRIVSSKVVRAQDYFARYGGEEFVILLSGSGLTSAHEVGERLRSTVESHIFDFESKIIPVTISIGVAQKKLSESDWDLLFDRADQALFKSKQTGRNKVTAAS